MSIDASNEKWYIFNEVVFVVSIWNEGGFKMKRSRMPGILSFIVLFTTMFAFLPSFAFASAISPMPTARSRMAAVEYNGRIYAIGGIDGSEKVLNTLEIYDPMVNKWVTAVPMPTARYDLAAAEYNGKIYAIGGIDGQGDVLNTVEVYNTMTNKWVTVAPVPIATAGAVAVEYNGDVYVIGGESQSGKPLNAVEIYDPQTNAWLSSE